LLTPGTSTRICVWRVVVYDENLGGEAHCCCCCCYYEERGKMMDDQKQERTTYESGVSMTSVARLRTRGCIVARVFGTGGRPRPPKPPKKSSRRKPVEARAPAAVHNSVMMMLCSKNSN